MSGLRRALYRWARILGDVQAVTSGDPKRMAKRFGNKVIGRSLVRRMWFK